jgi:1,4-alpha-glucan branching enzyme
LQEFEALIARTHQAGLKVIIDIVPNIARKYEGKNNPLE